MRSAFIPYENVGKSLLCTDLVNEEAVRAGMNDATDRIFEGLVVHNSEVA